MQERFKTSHQEVSNGERTLNLNNYKSWGLAFVPFYKILFNQR